MVLYIKKSKKSFRIFIKKAALIFSMLPLALSNDLPQIALLIVVKYLL
jgi:hypothetical protein